MRPVGEHEFIVISFYIIGGQAFIPGESQVGMPVLPLVENNTPRGTGRRSENAFPAEWLWQCPCPCAYKLQQCRPADLQVHGFSVVAICAADRIDDFRAPGVPGTGIETLPPRSGSSTGAHQCFCTTSRYWVAGWICLLPVRRFEASGGYPRWRCNAPFLLVIFGETIPAQRTTSLGSTSSMSIVADPLYLLRKVVSAVSR